MNLNYLQKKFWNDLIIHYYRIYSLEHLIKPIKLYKKFRCWFKNFYLYNSEPILPKIAFFLGICSFAWGFVAFLGQFEDIATLLRIWK